MKRATFYARVSTDHEEQQNSIENQIAGLKKYINDNRYTLADVGVFCKRNGESNPYIGYIDEGFSGAKSAKYRKAFQQMIKDAKSGFFDVIVTKSISRFGRNTREVLEYIDMLSLINIGVWFEDIKAYSLSSADKVKITIFAELATEESRSKSTSVQWAKRQAAEKGVWSGREPYGYNVYKGNDKELKGKLVINEKEAEVVREIFDLYIRESYGVNKIARIFTENIEKYPTKREGKKWTGSHIANILSNEIYIGQVWQCRTRKTDINLNKVEIVPEDEQIIFHDETLRIIDDETFKLAELEKQNRPHIENFKYKVETIDNELGKESTKKIRVGAKTNGKGRHSSAHLFSNLLRCVNCGGSMRKKVQKTTKQIHHYYYCRNNELYGHSVCEHRNLQREEELLEWVKQEILAHRSNIEWYENNWKMMVEARYDMEDIAQKIIKNKEKLQEMNQDKEANFKLYSKGIIDDNEYEIRNNYIKAEITNLENEIRRLSYIDNEIETLRLKYEKSIKYLQEIDVDNLTNAVLRQIILSIGVCTTYIPDQGIQTIRAIEWNFIGMSENEIIDEHVKKFVLK